MILELKEVNEEILKLGSCRLCGDFQNAYDDACHKVHGCSMKELRTKDSAAAQSFEDALFTNARLHGLDDSVYPFSIGGSEVATLLGVKTYAKNTLQNLIRSKEKLLRGETETVDEKTGLIFDAGHYAEDFIRQCYARFTNRPAISNTLQYASRNYPHCIGNPDGFTLDLSLPPEQQLGLLEFKTLGNSPHHYPVKQNWKKGQPPRNYILQCHFYMAITGLSWVDLVCMWGLRMDADSMAIVRIYKDDALETEMMRSVENFITKTYQSRRFEGFHSYMSGSDLVKSVTEKYPYDPTLPPKDLSEFQKQLDAVATLQEQIGEYERNIEEMKEKITELKDNQFILSADALESLGAAGYGNCRLSNGSTLRIEYKKAAPSRRFSSTALKKEHPALYESLRTKFFTITNPERNCRFKIRD